MRLHCDVHIRKAAGTPTLPARQGPQHSSRDRCCCRALRSGVSRAPGSAEPLSLAQNAAANHTYPQGLTGRNVVLQRCNYELASWNTPTQPCWLAHL